MGINHGLLNKKEYLPVVEKLGIPLNTAVHPDGKWIFIINLLLDLKGAYVTSIQLTNIGFLNN